jgi:hypothetical protein
MYRRRLFTVVSIAGVLAFGTAALSQCGGFGYSYSPPTTTTVTTVPATTPTTLVPCTTPTPVSDGMPPADMQAPPWGDNELISQSSGGELAAYSNTCVGVAPSGVNSISADGRYVAFDSGAVNLVPNDTNNANVGFVRDRVTGTTERIDVNNDGSQLVDGGGGSFISDDGRYATFNTRSPELVPPNGRGAFVRDRTAGTTTNVGILPDGSSATDAFTTGISPDGRYVPFDTPDPAVPNSYLLYIRDLLTQTTRFIAPLADTGYGFTSMTDNGEIVFTSSASNLVPNDTNGYPDIFVETLTTGAIDRVNLTNTGAQESGAQAGAPGGNINLSRKAISRDGRYVVFVSRSANMGVPAKQSRVFIRDRVAGTTELVSVINTSAPLCFSQNEGVSNDGRYVSFSALCEDATGDNIYLSATMVRDRLLGTTTQVDTLPDGTPGNADGRHQSFMSADGKWVVYGSSATNLVPRDTNTMEDVFIRRIS